MITINNRDTLEWKKHLTVRDVLNQMGYTYSLITVTVNEELIEEEDYDEYEIPNNALVSVFHLAHGG